MSVKIVCDFCDKPLEIEDDRCVVYFTKKIYTRNLFPHLCKNCAEKLDLVADIEPRIKMARKALLEKSARINQERREKLGTKG